MLMKIFIADFIPDQSVIDFLCGQKLSLNSSNLFSNINQVASLERSDAVLVPHDAYEFAANDDYMKYINNISKKKIVIFSDRSDFPVCPKIGNSISLRVAVNPGENKYNKIVVPYSILSLDQLPLRDYKLQPMINFTGFVPKIISPKRFLKSVKLNPQNFMINNSAILRNLSIRKCEKQLDNFSFTKRSYYYKSSKKYDERNIDRNEFLKNTSNSDIILAPRGDANQSQRFYETLSSGRIALLPNSKMMFPKVYLQSDIFKISTIMFSISELSLDKIVYNFWEKIQNTRNYHLRQEKIKKFYNDELNFDIFIKKLFSNNLDYIKSLANYRCI